MGQEVSHSEFTREQRLSFRERVITDLDVFEQMLEGSRFDFTRPQMGLEIELNLADSETFGPAMRNHDVLAELGDEPKSAAISKRTSKPASDTKTDAPADRSVEGTPAEAQGAADAGVADAAVKE